MHYKRFNNSIRIRSEPEQEQGVPEKTGGAMVVSLKDFDKWCGSGYTKLEHNPDVQACINIIANLVSSMTIMLMENGKQGDVRIKNGLSDKVDITPYKYGTRKTLIYKTVKELLLTGNSILLPVTKAGLLEELIPVSENEYSFIPFNNGYSVRYKGKTYDHDEIIHFVNNPELDQPWRGMPYQVYLKDILDNLATTQKVKKRFYTRDYKPNVVFIFNSDTENFQGLEGRDELYQKWIETKEGDPYILPAEVLDLKTIPSMSISDLAINDSATLDKKAVCSIFGVPPFLFGIGKFSEPEWNNFVNKTIVPICREIEQELTQKLIFSDKWYFMFNLKSIMAFDFDSRMSAFFQARKFGAVNNNEIRLNLGLPPSSDPIMDEYNMLENFIPNEDIGSQKKLEKMLQNGGDND